MTYLAKISFNFTQIMSFDFDQKRVRILYDLSAGAVPVYAELQRGSVVTYAGVKYKVIYNWPQTSSPVNATETSDLVFVSSQDMLVNAGGGSDVIFVDTYNSRNLDTVIDGGTGSDTAIFLNNPAVDFVQLRLRNGVYEVGFNNTFLGDKGTVWLKNIEYVDFNDWGLVQKNYHFRLLSGTNKADNLVASNEASFIMTGDGNDSVAGSANSDYIWLGSGNGRADADGGNDTVTAIMGGNDTISGGSGNDLISIAGAQTAFVDGGEGQDYFFGGGVGNPSYGSLMGGSGNDIFEIFDGIWNLSGGSESDTFFFHNNGKALNATILDFEKGKDQIVVESDTLTFASLQKTAITWFGSVLLTLNDHQTLYLKGVAKLDDSYKDSVSFLRS